ncbi:MAG: peptidylprolyl isomerase [Maricaulaceae bacterium]|nr:peptidylprolyl isomerase [Maricaulaceae bacterium]
MNAQNQPQAEAPPIRVNGAAITAEAVAAEAQNHPAPGPDAAWRAAAEALVIRELLLQRGRELGLTPEPRKDEAGRRETADEALMRAVIEQEVTAPKATEDECRRFYGNNTGKFRSPDIYEPAHILFSADRADKTAFDKALGEAEAALSALKADPKAFEGLAKARSDCPSGKEGGRLGQVTPGQTTPEFETFMTALEEGQICDTPVKTRYGVHIIRLDRKQAGETLPFEAVKDRIAAWLAEASWRRAAAQYVQILLGEAKIEGLDMGGADSPLVQ